MPKGVIKIEKGMDIQENRGTSLGPTEHDTPKNRDNCNDKETDKEAVQSYTEGSGNISSIGKCDG